MRRALACAATAVALLAGAGIRAAGGVDPAPAPDLAAWVYEAHRWTPAEAAAELARRPARATRLYVSVESGRRLVLDDPGDAERTSALLEAAAARGVGIEAMLLQDPAWGSDLPGALERTTRVLAFQAARRAAGRPAFAGLHFDVEPHTEASWACADADGRRERVRALRQIFAAVAARARAADPALRLSAALPWWLGPLAEIVPEAAPAGWLADLDEVVLMVYGDPGGPLVGETPAAVLRRVDDTRLWADLPPGRGLRIGLATYEYRDAAALEAALGQVAAALGSRPGFRGLAVFGHGQPFDAPLVTVAEGRLLDRHGAPVAGARIRAGDRAARSNRCGLFVLRGLPETARLTVSADGFRPAQAAVAGLRPGRLRTLAPLVLERAP